MEDWFMEYSQQEREYLKRVIRKIYQLKKDEVDKASPKNRAMTLANIFIKNIIQPKFFRDDAHTLKDVFKYSEWIINHWLSVSKLVSNEPSNLLLRDEETIIKINRLKKKIDGIEGKTIHLEKLDGKHRILIESGKTPDKIKLDKLDGKSVDAAIRFLEEIEKAV